MVKFSSDSIFKKNSSGNNSTWRHVEGGNFRHAGYRITYIVTWTWSGTEKSATCITTTRCTTSPRSVPTGNVVVWNISVEKYYNFRPFWSTTSFNLLTSVLTNHGFQVFVYRFAVREHRVSKQMPQIGFPALPVQFVVVDDLVFVALFCQQQVLLPFKDL